MATRNPAPTYADPVEVDPRTGKPQFAPIWLKWFLDLAATLEGSGEEGVDHELLTNLLGGAANNHWHLTKAQRDNLLAFMAAGDGWTEVAFTSDFTTTSTTAVDVTGMAFTPVANTTYTVEAHLLIQSDIATTGMRPGISWPTDISSSGASIRVPESSTTEALENGNATATMESQATSVPTASQTFLAVILATFRTGASPSGSFKITLAAE